ncbi:MAG TPA: hypothetical protein VIJ12_07475 [Candidatus Baltobacteraceae bacterium]
MKRSGLLLLVLALAACGADATTSSSGTLAPGSHMTVHLGAGQLDAYKPKVGDAPDKYTIASSDQTMSTLLQIAHGPKSLSVTSRPAADTGDVLVRIPDGVTLDASSQQGDVNVTDITGVANAHADDGNVKVMVEGYAQASAGNGNVTVYMGSTDWPGTLHFGSQLGDVEVWINATANFHIRMHTDRGTIFTDFLLRGTSRGLAETIDGNVGTPSTHGIDIEAHNGSIRLLQLKPQI